MNKFRSFLLRSFLSLLLTVSLILTIFAIPSSAKTQETIREGNLMYPVPRLSTKQSQQLVQAQETVNQAIRNKRETITFSFSGFKQFTPSEQMGLRLKIFQGAFRLHQNELQNGMYMFGTVIPTFRHHIDGNTHTMEFRYHLTAQQDNQAWQKARSLVRQLNISSDPKTGLRQIFEYIVANYEYDWATQKAVYQEAEDNDFRKTPPLPNCTAYGMLYPSSSGKPKGICSGFAQLFYLMGRAKGWNIYLIRNQEHTHTYNYTIIGNTPVYFDCCQAAVTPEKKDRYFWQTQSQLNQTDTNHKGEVL